MTKSVDVINAAGQVVLSQHAEITEIDIFL